MEYGKKSATFPSISQPLCRFELEIVFRISSRLIGISNCSICMCTSVLFVLNVWLSSGGDIVENCFTKSSRLTSLLVLFVRLNFFRYFQNLRGDVFLMFAYDLRASKTVSCFRRSYQLETLFFFHKTSFLTPYIYH